jgi:osmotically-inducible protein OsmY
VGDANLGVFDQVLVEVKGGQVRLSGSVEQRQRGEIAAASVARLSGVLEVRNDIELQASAPEDVMLRRRIFERFYHGGGVRGSERPEWPVRIVVNDGRVILTGELADSASREQLETMASSAGARFVETRLQAPTGSVPIASARR